MQSSQVLNKKDYILESTLRLAEFLVNTLSEKIPELALLAVRNAFTDCIGGSIPGSRTESAQIMIRFVQESKSSGDAGVIGANFRCHSTLAALANGVSAHALDYDDLIRPLGHASAVLVPVGLAMGEELGLPGRKILEAYVLAVEVGAKLGACLSPDHGDKGWHSTSTLGAITGAAMASRLLNLDMDQTCSALALAVSQAAGIRLNFGYMAKPFQAGNAARGGVTAALLAQKGFSGNPEIFEGPLGFCSLYGGRPEDLDQAIERLGAPFHLAVSEIQFKRYPCCGGGQQILDALLLDILPNVSVKVEEVSQVEVSVPAFSFGQAMFHRRPKTGLQGKFSSEYCVAAALIDGKIRLATFTDEAVLRPAAQEFLEKVSVAPHEGEGQDDYSEVTLKLRDGSRHTARVEHAQGSLIKPLTREQAEQKFRDCASTVLSEKKVAESIALITRLDEANDITSLLEGLRVPDRF
ncbi:MAG: hypothetical protein BBJ57_04395 [Desulfobacterales bacterium PC51MH44]|nr:MAG: hypothetical protein BBJ57_04395 [Desulfobacterales bacterium PC51MH44]